MEIRELLVKQYARIWMTTDNTLTGLTPTDLAKRPSPESNSIGWLAWHVARVEDRWTSMLNGRDSKRTVGSTMPVDHLWSRRWVRTMGMTAEQGSGVGVTPSGLASFFTPSEERLRPYVDAVRTDTRTIQT